MLASPKQPSTEQQPPEPRDGIAGQKTGRTPSLEPEQQNQSLLQNNPGSAPKTPPAPTPKAEAEKAKEKDSDRDFDFKTSIWDYLFGGTVQPRRNPKSFEDFEAQVNA